MTLTNDQKKLYGFLRQLGESALSPVAMMAVHLLIDRFPADEQKQILLGVISNPDKAIQELQEPQAQEQLKAQKWVIPTEKEAAKLQLQRAALAILKTNFGMHNIAEIAYWAL